MLTYNQEKDVVTGSKPFAAVLVNDIVSSTGLHTASPADLENILRTDTLPLRGTYEDTALVLRDEEEPNSYLAKNLMDQLRLRGKVETPVMIPLKDLTLKNDAQSPYGLAFVLKESAQPVHAPILNKESGSAFTSEDVDEKIGLPKKVGKGNRRLWTRSSGLSRLCMVDGLGLGAGSGNLASSDDAGRVVVVSAGGAKKKF